MKLTPSLRNAVLAFAVAIVLPFHRNGGGFTNFLADAGAFVLLALGLNIVVGFAGLLDLGYAAFFAIGSYAFAMLASPQFGVHLPFWVVLFAASGIAAIFGILLGGPNGISSLDQPVLLGHRFGFDPLPYYLTVLALIALAVWVASNLRNSRLGRAWMAIREDELAAAHMGINTTTAKLSAFALGASFSGLAGCALASKLSLVSPDQFGFNVSVYILAMLVLGGMGNIPGVIAGSLILSSLERFILPQATNFLHGLGLTSVDLSSSRFMIYGVILVLMMLFRPEGLIPSRQRKAELHAAELDRTAAAAQQELYGEAVR